MQEVLALLLMFAHLALEDMEELVVKSQDVLEFFKMQPQQSVTEEELVLHQMSVLDAQLDTEDLNVKDQSVMDC